MIVMEPIYSSSPHHQKEYENEWACDIMKRLIEAGGEGSEVGDSDEEMPPHVLRSVTQELHSSLELEEQPPLVGRAHTTEF